MKKRLRYYDQAKRGDLVLELPPMFRLFNSGVSIKLYSNLVLGERNDALTIANSYTDDNVMMLFVYGKQTEIDDEDDLVVS